PTKNCFSQRFHLMIRINIDYTGQLRCQATHEPSGNKIITDAPVDNHGKGEAFSPTDLAATSLGVCMMTIMGIAASKRDVSLEGLRASVDKEMSADSPRRIKKLTVHLHVPLAEGDINGPILEKVALNCPVHHSLHPEIEKEI